MAQQQRQRILKNRKDSLRELVVILERHKKNAQLDTNGYRDIYEIRDSVSKNVRTRF